MSKRLTRAILPLILLAPTGLWASDEFDPMKLQGKWRVISFTQQGQEVEHFHGVTWTFDGESLEIRDRENELLTESTFDARSTNAAMLEIDLADSVDGVSHVSPGIAKLEGETLQLCYRIRGDRPIEFVSDEASRSALLRLERVDD